MGNCGTFHVAGAARGAIGMAILAAAAMPTAAQAHHAWGDYHWQTADGTVTVPVVDNTTGLWGPYVKTAVADWNVPVAAGAPDAVESPLLFGALGADCPMTQGRIEVCSADYGATEWLGIASLATADRHVVAATTKLNDHYFVSGSFYDDPSWRALVACQEIGHNYGLDHQNEDFSTKLTTSCMEYTTPALGNETPDFHDYEELAAIYAHDIGGGETSPTKGRGKPGKGDDTTGGGGGKGGKGKKLGIVTGDGSKAWGSPVRYDKHGRADTFMRSDRGMVVITHVTWADKNAKGASGRASRARRR